MPGAREQQTPRVFGKHLPKQIIELGARVERRQLDKMNQYALIQTGGWAAGPVNSKRFGPYLRHRFHQQTEPYRHHIGRQILDKAGQRVVPCPAQNAPAAGSQDMPCITRMDLQKFKSLGNELVCKHITSCNPLYCE
jgi:hypothetical protein